MGAFSRLAPCQKGMLRTEKRKGVRSTVAALRGLLFAAALQVAERVSEVFCLVGSAFCRGLTKAVEKAKVKRPIRTEEILRELSERSGYRVAITRTGSFVSFSGHPLWATCHYLDDPAGLLGLLGNGRKVTIEPYYDLERRCPAWDARRLREVRG
jgi:hypothetical protein